MPTRGQKGDEDAGESIHGFSIEKLATMVMSLQEIVISLQGELHASKEMNLTLGHKVEMQNMEIKGLQKELDAVKKLTLQMQDNRMPEIERKMTSLEEEKEMLMRANAEMKSTLEAKEEVLMTKWKDVLLREAPKIDLVVPNANVDAKEQYEIERRKNNVVIRGIEEDESENALSLSQKITKFFEEHFAMSDVAVYAAHRVGKKRLEGATCRAIVCRILDERKRAMILDSSRVYLKGSKFFVTEDRTPKEQERRRQAYENRKAAQNA